VAGLVAVYVIITVFTFLFLLQHQEQQQQQQQNHGMNNIYDNRKQHIRGGGGEIEEERRSDVGETGSSSSSSNSGGLDLDLGLQVLRLHAVPAPSIWSTKKLTLPIDVHTNTATIDTDDWDVGFDLNTLDLRPYLTTEEQTKIQHLCGKFFYSTLEKAVRVEGSSTPNVYVGTGDIDNMWIRDSMVQLSLYLNLPNQPWVRLLVEGSIRRNAFNIIQDPYANSYNKKWLDPSSLPVKERVIGRGGYVATKNYELDSGAYYLNFLYDYYRQPDFYNPESLLLEPIIFESVLLLVETWITEQHHDTHSSYRYFELEREGKGPPTRYTGMTWSGFRPSDDPCQYGYNIPSNIHAASALEKILILNAQLWKHMGLHQKVTKLLTEIESGIHKYGIIRSTQRLRRNNNTSSALASSSFYYAYEVDGFGNKLTNFDDANIPSLLSIPLLGWTKYDHAIYKTTRTQLLSSSTNTQTYYNGTLYQGIGSPHTPQHYVWPMSFIVQGLTEIHSLNTTSSSTGNTITNINTNTNKKSVEKKMAFQMKQLLQSAYGDAMHESVHVNSKNQFTRYWFKWANALFVIYAQATIPDLQCQEMGSQLIKNEELQKI